MKMRMNSSSLRIHLCEFFIWGFIYGMDRFTKYLAITHLKNQNTVYTLWKFIELRYYENSGSAFGLLEGQKVFFILTALVIELMMILLLFRIPNDAMYNPLRLSLMCLFSGATCNMTDRIIYPGVIDFISISGIRSPIWNLADIIVTFGAILLLCLLIFRYKENDFKFIYLKSQKIRQLK